MESLTPDEGAQRFTTAYARAIGRDQAEVDTFGLIPSLDFTWCEDLDDALVLGSITPDQATTLLRAYQTGYHERARQFPTRTDERTTPVTTTPLSTTVQSEAHAPKARFDVMTQDQALQNRIYAVPLLLLAVFIGSAGAILNAEYGQFVVFALFAAALVFAPLLLQRWRIGVYTVAFFQVVLPLLALALVNAFLLPSAGFTWTSAAGFAALGVGMMRLVDLAPLAVALPLIALMLGCAVLLAFAVPHAPSLAGVEVEAMQPWAHAANVDARATVDLLFNPLAIALAVVTPAIIRRMLARR